MSSKDGLYDDEAGGQYIRMNIMRIFPKCKLQNERSYFVAHEKKGKKSENCQLKNHIASILPQKKGHSIS